MAVLSHHDAGTVVAQTLLLLLTASSSLLGAVVPALAADPPFSCGPSSTAATQGYAFCDATLPVAQRAANLVARLTTAEKVAQLGDEAAGIPRLGVPAYKWWNEALHGLATSGKGLHFNGAVRSATSFPQVSLTAAAFDDDLWFRIGQVRTYVRTHKLPVLAGARRLAGGRADCWRFLFAFSRT
uniref:Uncharacterized protein n=1 Tax=Aegilops tauschii subsp. strangulata TaxID=200361 RepID=A0A453HDI0_AEGTS